MINQNQINLLITKKKINKKIRVKTLKKRKKAKEIYTIPCAFIASTTFLNPAMLAPAT